MAGFGGELQLLLFLHKLPMRAIGGKFLPADSGNQITARCGESALDDISLFFGGGAGVGLICGGVPKGLMASFWGALSAGAHQRLWWVDLVYYIR